MRRKKLAYFSPLKPDRTAIADYSEKLLPELARFFSIDLYSDGTPPSTPSIASRFRWFPVREFELQIRRTQYDLNVYQAGNSHYHRFIYPVMARYPGAVVLHDANIHHSRAYYHLQQHRPGGYIDEITWCHGDSGARIGPAIANGYHNPVLYDRFPMLRLVTESSLSVLVHNRFAHERIRTCMDDDRIFTITLPFSDTDLPSYSEARAMLGIGPKEFLVVSFGFLTPEKRLHSVMDAFELFQQECPESRYVCVGEPIDDDYGRWIHGRAQEIPNVLITGYIDEKAYKHWLAACDACVQLRYPTQGESSDALIRIMGAGKPAVIPAYRQFLEIPESICVHIPLWPNEAFSVLAALRELASDPVMAVATGRNAREYILRHHSVPKWVQSVVDGLTNTMTLPKIQPLSRRCELRHIRTAPVAECLGISLSGWGNAARHPLVIEPLVQVMAELGIDE